MRRSRAIPNRNEVDALAGIIREWDRVNFEVRDRMLDALGNHRIQVIHHRLPFHVLGAGLGAESIIAQSDNQVPTARIRERRYLLA